MPPAGGALRVMSNDRTLFAALAAALRDRRAVIADREGCLRDPSGHLERLKAVSETITSLQQRLPAHADRRLLHFLERCSYDKALSFLGEMNR